ncbi:uncharacterized protein NPIL_322011 [Nephila pilipes]|uniref:Uncharacterized protein n=1 Tax=Nephila pilipes TaxID=299642 RepID=A0A8X6P8T7_NEPPI|nr:uncharacterized protein NPIL_322011 [Nephila pilipes]
MAQLLLWWIIRVRRKNIHALVRKLESLKAGLDFRDYKKLMVLSKLAVYGVLLVIFLKPSVRIWNSIRKPDLKKICLLLQVNATLEVKHKINFVFFEFFSSYVETCITYATVIFYSMFCVTFALCLKFKMRSRSQTHRIYLKTLQIFEKFEETFSIMMFIVFAVLLLRIFRNLVAAVFVYNKSNTLPLNDSTVQIVLDVFLAFAIVFSAESMQNNADVLRQSLFSYSNSPYNFSFLSAQYVKISEDRKRLRLTAWNTFVVRKSLLLTLAGWIFTYVVILL